MQIRSTGPSPFGRGWRNAPGVGPHPAVRDTFSRREKDTSLLLLSILAVFLFSCSHKEEPPQETEHSVTVDVAPVLSSAISLKVTADALLYPIQQAAIFPKISAPVRKLYVDRGSR